MLHSTVMHVAHEKFIGFMQPARMECQLLLLYYGTPYRIQLMQALVYCAFTFCQTHLHMPRTTCPSGYNASYICVFVTSNPPGRVTSRSHVRRCPIGRMVLTLSGALPCRCNLDDRFVDTRYIRLESVADSDKPSWRKSLFVVSLKIASKCRRITQPLALRLQTSNACTLPAEDRRLNTENKAYKL
jgi:hypothetical protein